RAAPPAPSAPEPARPPRTRARPRPGSRARWSPRAARPARWPRAAPTPRACAARARLAPEAGEQVAVRVDAAIPQEGPAAPLGLDPAEVAVAPQPLFGRLPRLREDPALRVGDEGAAPEAHAAAFVSDPVRRAHEHAVRDRVAALHGLPRVAHRGVLRVALGV